MLPIRVPPAFESPSEGEATDYEFSFNGNSDHIEQEPLQEAHEVPQVNPNEDNVSATPSPQQSPNSPRPGPSREQPRPGPSREQPRPGPSRKAPRPGPSRAPAPARNATTGRARPRKQPRPRRRDFGWLRDVRRLQKSVANLIPRLPFSRLVREIIHEYARADMRITREALMAIQESAEMYLTYFFEDTNRLAIHAKRVTIMPRDMQLIFSLRKNWGLD